MAETTAKSTLRGYMKRSEMLDILDAALLETWRIEGRVGSADDILSLLEEMDMLPPVRPHKIPHAYSRFVEHCKWESEDE
tara:strand:- start:5150 stop:5389 length:240 start_codon:yes stop_codon:yes gene_type:complete